MTNFETTKDALLLLAEQDSDIDALWIYGSRAKGNASEHSDIDIAVLFSSYLDDVLDRRLRPETLALDWIELLSLSQGDISIIDLDIAPVPLAMGVLQTGQLLVNKSASHEFNSSRIIMSKWELDYQYHYKTYGNQ